jgi:hypothetical protein
LTLSATKRCNMPKPTRLNGSSDFPCHDPKFTLTIRTGNAAFEHHPHREIARILYEAAEALVRRGQTEGKLRDHNGNTVGEFKLT